MLLSGLVSISFVVPAVAQDAMPTTAETPSAVQANTGKVMADTAATAKVSKKKHLRKKSHIKGQHPHKKLKHRSKKGQHKMKAAPAQAEATTAPVVNN